MAVEAELLQQRLDLLLEGNLATSGELIRSRGDKRRQKNKRE
jgi:hypothetical protein